MVTSELAGRTGAMSVVCAVWMSTTEARSWALSELFGSWTWLEFLFGTNGSDMGATKLCVNDTRLTKHTGGKVHRQLKFTKWNPIKSAQLLIILIFIFVYLSLDIVYFNLYRPLSDIRLAAPAHLQSYGTLITLIRRKRRVICMARSTNSLRICTEFLCPHQTERD